MAEFVTPDICVIGGGIGGLAVARRARAYGASVVLVEKGRLGGETLHAASLPARALVAAARRAQLLRTATPFGIANDVPKINARGVFDHVHQVIDGSAQAVTPDQLTALGIELIAAPGRFLDRRTLEAGDRRIRARRFVIATGSRPLLPPIPGLAEVPYFTSASIFDNPRKLTHLVIIGAGPTGIELGQAFRRLGSDVTILDTATPLAHADPELVEVVLNRLAEEGVDLRPRTEVTAVQQRSLGIGVAVRSLRADGSATEQILDASHILVAAGRVAAVDGLGLDRAGVTLHAGGGLVLKRNLKTTNGRIYAVGDVAGGPQHSHAAAYHAELVARHALFGLPVGIDAARIPTAIFTDPEIAETGLTEPLARARGKTGFAVHRLSLAENDRARAERQGYGLVKLVTGRGGRLLGAGAVGPGAADIVSLFGFAIGNRMSLQHFRRFIAPYPTLMEVARSLAAAEARDTAEHPWLGRLIAVNRWLP